MEWKKLNLSYRKIYTTTTTILLNEWNIVPSGPGKEFLSRYTHQQTKRDPQPFILGLLQLALGSNPLEIEQKWYFVSKIVLTYCEKKLFCLFVCSRVRSRCEPWGSLSSLCLTIITIFAEFPEVTSSLYAIKNHFRILDQKIVLLIKKIFFKIFQNSKQNNLFKQKRVRPFFNLFLEVSQIKFIRKIIIQIGKNYWDLEICRKSQKKLNLSYCLFILG